MKIHYLEIVTPDVDAMCNSYVSAHNVKFAEPDPPLGGARTCSMADGGIVGVRNPLRDTEDSVVRPYWLVEDIERAIDDVIAQGAKIAVPPMEIPGKGIFAIYIIGAIDHGFWQL